MVDVLRSIRVGNLSEAKEIGALVHGSVAIDLPSVAATHAIASASAAVTGLTSSHKVLLMAQSWLASSAIAIKAAVCINGGIQVTAQNASGSAINMGAITYNFFAWR